MNFNEQFSQPKPAWRLKLSNGVGLAALFLIIVGALLYASSF